MNNEIDLWSLLKFYGKHWYVIAVLTAVGLGTGFTYNTFIQTPVYRSDAKITFINTKTGSSARTVRDISNYADLVTSRNVLNKAIESSHENITYSQLAASTSVKNDKNTDVIDISVTTENPYRSAFLAQGITDAFVKEVANVYKLPLDEVRVIDTAQRVDTPVNVRKELQLLLAGGIGFIVALIVLFFALDFKNSRSNADDEEDAGTPAPVAPARRPAAQRPPVRQKTIPDDSIDLPDDFFDDIQPDTPPKRAQTRSPQKPGAAYTKRS